MSTADLAMMHGDHDGGYEATVGWFGLLGLLVLALTALAVVASLWLVQHLSSSRARDHGDVLARRYAAGEIDREAYLRLREDLEVLQ